MIFFENENFAVCGMSARGAEIADFFRCKLLKIYLIDRNVEVFKIVKSTKKGGRIQGKGGKPETCLTSERIITSGKFEKFETVKFTALNSLLHSSLFCSSLFCSILLFLKT